MKASFITGDGGSFDVKGPFPPALYFRKAFSVAEGLTSAELAMTSMGNYIPFVNGQKPDCRLLTPGYTEYSRRLQVQTYDVTGLLSPGENVLGAILGDGWYRGSCGPFGHRATYGEERALAAELVLNYGDRTEVIRTDPSWKVTDQGPVRTQDLKMEEHYDARMEIPGWCEAGFCDSGWKSSQLVLYTGELIPDEGEIVCAHECFAPRVLHTPNGDTVLDFGQNMAGFVTFTVTGSAGQTVHLWHGEALDEEGCFTTKNLGSDRFMPLGQEIIYDLKDGTQTFTPRFLICGFRYVKLSDWPEEVRPENFAAYAVYSDVRITGVFSCSNEKINRLVKNVEWSLKSNFVEIPTDCPQRERAGWTGDINVFIECANLLADTKKFISKWLKDVVLTQTAEGAILSIVPGAYTMTRKTRESTPGAAGWADAIVNVPLQLYKTYGDPAVLRDCYDAMKKHVEFNRRRAEKNSVRSLFGTQEGRRYIVDTGFHYGEWLEPGAANLADALKASLAPDAEVATAWFFYSTKELAEVASVLGEKKDAARYRALAKKIRDAYRARFVPNGKITSKRMCKYVRPLYMGLLEGEEAASAAAALNDLVIQNGYRIGTGFLSTYQILNVLTDYGYHDTACRMLENEDCPGWLYEVNKGATTIWEGWDAIDPETGRLKAKSLNHYSPGAAISWLWTRLCGIRALAPGYTEIEIAPKPGGTLTAACAAYDSPAGRIVSDWRMEDGRFSLRATIPEGVDARVILPDGSVIEHAESGEYSC